jgi:hypothetical protein
MGMYINGNFHNHASAEISFKGKPYLGVSAINYSDEIERELQYGTGREPLGLADGTYKPSADVELLKTEFDRLIRDLGDGYGEQLISIVVSFREASGTIVDTLGACKISKVEDASQQGASGNKTKLTLTVTGVIKRNGKGLIKTKDRPRVAIRS